MADRDQTEPVGGQSYEAVMRRLAQLERRVRKLEEVVDRNNLS